MHRSVDLCAQKSSGYSCIIIQYNTTYGQKTNISKLKYRNIYSGNKQSLHPARTYAMSYSQK